MERETPKIYVALDNHQVENQSVLVEVGGNIAKKTISVLIDPWYTHTYDSPKVVESCSLGKVNHNKS